METFVKFVIYAAAGLILLLLNVAYGQRLIAEFRKGPKPPVVPPLQLLGKTDAATAGPAMAQMVIAKVSAIQKELNDAAKMLQRDETAKERQLSLDLQPDVNASLGTVNQFDAKVSLAGVELTGFIAWLQRSLTADRVINIAVQYGQNKTVASVSPSAGGEAMLIQMDGTDEAVVIENVAYAVHKRLIDSKMPAWRQLTVPQYRALIQIIIDTAQLNRRRTRATEEDYRKLSARIAELNAAADLNWAPLSELAAQIAERADDLGTAARTYREALAAAPTPAARRDIEAKLKAVEQKLEVKEKAIAAAASSPNDPAVQALQPAIEFHNAANLQMTRDLRVAVIGPPPGDLLDYEEVVPASSANLRADTHIAALMAGIGASVRALAPRARVVYVWRDVTPGGGPSDLSVTNLAASLDAALNANAEVILFAYKTTAEGRDAFAHNIAAAVAQEKLVILPAGNEPDGPMPFADSPIQSKLAVVSAVDRNGTAASFTTRGSTSLWALGVDVPVTPRDGKKVTLMSGTSFAAAFAAGAAARVLDQKPGLKPAQVVDLLRTSSAPKPNGERVISVAQAIAQP